MTNKDFLNLKRRLDKLFEELENEALKEGVNTLSNEFQLVFRELKRKILAEKGISLEDYEKLEEETYSIGKVGDAFKNMADVIDEQSRNEKEESQQRIKELQEEYSAKIGTLAKESEGKIQVLTEQTDAEKKELLKGIKALLTTFEKQKVISDKQIEELKERFFRETIRKDREMEEIKNSIELLPTDEDIKKKIDGIKIPQPQKIETISPDDIKKLRELSKENLEKWVEAYVRNWTSWPVRGLRTDTQSRSGFVDDEIPTGDIDGVNKTFTLVYAPNPAKSLKVYVNGVRQILTTDYSLNGRTLTTIYAYPVGTALWVDYRH